MIKVDRSSVSLSRATFASLEESFQEIRAFYAAARKNAQSRYEPDRKALDLTLGALINLFSSKCAFCESYIPKPANRHIMHFRPPSNARDFKAHFSPEHYWWFCYEWTNLYLACTPCIQSKSTYFPVEGARMRPPAGDGKVELDSPSLLDPCKDEPDRFLRFEENGNLGFVPHGTGVERGYATINIFNLNRKDLVRERRKTAVDINLLATSIRTLISEQKSSQRDKLVKQKLAELNVACSPSQPYLAVRRQLVSKLFSETPEIRRSWLTKALGNKHHLGLIRSPASVKTTPKGKAIRKKKAPKFVQPKDEYKNLRLRRVTIENFRAIDQLVLSFNEYAEPQPMSIDSADLSMVQDSSLRAGWKVLLGENGCGKTSVLRAIALALCGKDRYDEMDPPFQPKNFGNRNAPRSKGFIEVELSDDKPSIRIDFDGKNPPDFSSRPEGCKDVFVRAYGATRIVDTVADAMQTERTDSYVWVDNLFDPFKTFVEPNDWLLSLDDESFDWAARTIRDILDIPEEIKPILTRTKTVVSLRSDTGKAHPLADYSHGYRSVLTVVADIFAGTPDSLSDKKLATGIVLLDELDLHLHPKWKMRIVPALRKAFPNIQFIATTHEPLCLRGFGAREIAIIQRAAGELIVDDEVSSPAGLRVDQLLTSPLFGLSSTIDPGIDTKFQEYYRLLAKSEKLSPSETARMNALRGELNRQTVLGFTRRDQIALSIIDEYLAHHPAKSIRPEIDDVTKQKIWDLWTFKTPESDN